MLFPRCCPVLACVAAAAMILLAPLTASAEAPANDELLERACTTFVAMSAEHLPEDVPTVDECKVEFAALNTECANGDEVLGCIADMSKPEHLLACVKQCEETLAATIDDKSPEGVACNHAVTMLQSEGLGASANDVASCMADLQSMKGSCAAYDEMLACVGGVTDVQGLFTCMDKCGTPAASATSGRKPKNLPTGKSATAAQACSHLADLARAEGESVSAKDMPDCHKMLATMTAECTNADEVLGCMANVSSPQDLVPCLELCVDK